MRLRLLLLSLLLTLLGAAPAAQAAGTPDISMNKDAPGSVLFGEDSTVTLSASNPSGPTGYNLSFRDVLPVGVSYVAGSASVAPRVLPNAPAAGQTTLLFENVSDLSGGSSYSLSYQVRHSTTTYNVGSSYTNNAGAYVNSDPRFLPKFTATGTPIGPLATSYTGFATDSATTQIAAIEILKSEPSPEGELLRGAHDHQTVYTLNVRNNGVQPTTNLVVDDYLPAGLEFLGCGTTDNTTDAPTNPGETDEYAAPGRSTRATLRRPRAASPQPSSRRCSPTPTAAGRGRWRSTPTCASRRPRARSLRVRPSRCATSRRSRSARTPRPGPAG